MNILCRVAESNLKYMSQWPCAVAKIETRSGLPADECFWLHWVTKLPIRLTHDLNHTEYSFRGALQQLIYRQKLKVTDRVKQVLNSNWWDMFSQELISGAILSSGLTDCFWSFVLRMGSLSIVCVNYVTFACCKLYFCHPLPRKSWRFCSSSLIIC